MTVKELTKKLWHCRGKMNLLSAPKREEKPKNQQLWSHQQRHCGAAQIVFLSKQCRALVNSGVMCTVCVVYNFICDVGCLSHTINHVGEHLSAPSLELFYQDLDRSFCTQPKNSACMDNSNWFIPTKLFSNQMVEQVWGSEIRSMTPLGM